MVQNRWQDPSRKIAVCIDSYCDGILTGRFYTPSREVEHFSSLSQFLLKMEEYLDEAQKPQSYTSVRRFASLLEPVENREYGGTFSKGTMATFHLQILFRQHSSWQGLLAWREGNGEQSFRSVLELVLLMDSALRGLEGSDVA